MDLSLTLAPVGTTGLLCTLRPGAIIEYMHGITVGLLVRERLRASPGLHIVILSL